MSYEERIPGKVFSSELDGYIQALINGDYKRCLAYIQDYLKNEKTFIQLYEDILKKALYEVGKMWEYNQITVATEHLATSITESLLSQVYAEIYGHKSSGKKIVLSSGEKEEHRVGIRMVADVFDSYGWETFFLGANMPAKELISFIHGLKPDLIALSLSVYYNLDNFENMLQQIRGEFPLLPILIGGQAFNHGGKEKLLALKGVTFIPDLYSLENFINKNF
jgi:methanogenic corrinoid protein MtbC1